MKLRQLDWYKYLVLTFFYLIFLVVTFNKRIFFQTETLKSRYEIDNFILISPRYNIFHPLHLSSESSQSGTSFLFWSSFTSFDIHVLEYSQVLCLLDSFVLITCFPVFHRLILSFSSIIFQFFRFPPINIVFFFSRGTFLLPFQ